MSENLSSENSSDEPVEGIVEPQFADAADGEEPGGSLARRFAKIVFYGGAACLLGVMLAVNASPSFAAQVGRVIPTQLASLAGADTSAGGCSMSGGCSSSANMMAASAGGGCPMSGGCSSMSDAAMASAGGCCSSQKSAMMASADAGGCCSSTSRASLMVSADGETSSCCSQSGAAMASAGGCCSQSKADTTLAGLVDDAFAADADEKTCCNGGECCQGEAECVCEKDTMAAAADDAEKAEETDKAEVDSDDDLAVKIPAADKLFTGGL